MKFKDRSDAGKKLAEALKKYKGTEAVIYAMPRGGVPLGDIIAESLDLPLDLVIVRKVTHPTYPEFAICAVTESGRKICSEEVDSIDSVELKGLTESEIAEAKRRREVYLKGRRRVSPEGKTAIIIDDGVATGLTMKLAIEEIRDGHPKRIVVAVPVAPEDVYKEIAKTVDDFIVLDASKFYLGAVGSYYDEFHQLEDDEVTNLLKKHNDNIQPGAI